MKKSATIALVFLLTLSIGLSAYLVLDQQEKKKLLSTQKTALAKHLDDFNGLKTKHEGLASKLVVAEQAAADTRTQHAKLKSENDFLQARIKAKEAELLIQAKAPNEATLKLQEELDALKKVADEKATELAALEAKNTSLEAQVTNHQKQHQEDANALAEAQTALRPFQALNRTPDEITKGLMKRPVNISKPLPPRPATQAGKITQPIPIPAPSAPTPTNQP